MELPQKNIPRENTKRSWENEKITEEDNVVAWWNGGGKLVPRIRANPELQKFLATKPDMFAYGEALVYRGSKEHVITGYKTILHKAQTEGIRRGIVVFYRDKHTHSITKAASSKEFDILWIRMKTKKEERIFGFFYAPGAHKEESTRERFYDELRRGVDGYSDRRVYLMGDSNARLGEYSGDTDIHGKSMTNKNKPLFMGLVQYTGMTYLNRTYACGKPTYEILGQKKIHNRLFVLKQNFTIKHVKLFKNQGFLYIFTVQSFRFF